MDRHALLVSRSVWPPALLAVGKSLVAREVACCPSLCHASAALRPATQGRAQSAPAAALRTCSGTLRELPKQALRRADALVLHNVDLLGERWL